MPNCFPIGPRLIFLFVSFQVANMDNSPCSQSESESSLDGHALSNSMAPPSPVSREQLQKRIDSLNQQNKVLRVELDTYKIRVKQLQEENKTLRQASVNIVSFCCFINEFS
jgi:hypothetical protein